MKMMGIIKWYKKDKKYGYIIGADDEEYFFNNVNCINPEEDFNEGDKVLFIPEFVSMDHATKVEKVTE